MNRRKLLYRVLTSPRNVRFEDFCLLLKSFGFKLDRVSGSHHIFKCDGVIELINIQDVHGYAKPYQIKQFLSLVERYNLEMEE